MGLVSEDKGAREDVQKNLGKEHHLGGANRESQEKFKELKKSSRGDHTDDDEIRA